MFSSSNLALYFHSFLLFSKDVNNIIWSLNHIFNLTLLCSNVLSFWSNWRWLHGTFCSCQFISFEHKNLLPHHFIFSKRDIFFDDPFKDFCHRHHHLWCNIRCCRKCAVCWKADNDYVQKPKDQHDVIG